MRLEEPPERITAASMSFFLGLSSSSASLGLAYIRPQFLKKGAACCTTTRDLVCAYGMTRFDSYFFVRSLLRVAAHGDQFGDDADGNFFGGERADFKAHGRVDALEFLRAIAFFLQRFVD